MKTWTITLLFHTFGPETSCDVGHMFLIPSSTEQAEQLGGEGGSLKSSLGSDSNKPSYEIQKPHQWIYKYLQDPSSNIQSSPSS